MNVFISKMQRGRSIPACKKAYVLSLFLLLPEGGGGKDGRHSENWRVGALSFLVLPDFIFPLNRPGALFHDPWEPVAKKIPMKRAPTLGKVIPSCFIWFMRTVKWCPSCSFSYAWRFIRGDQRDGLQVNWKNTKIRVSLPLLSQLIFKICLNTLDILIHQITVHMEFSNGTLPWFF